MQDIRIRDLRDALAHHVNTAMNEGQSVGITRDGRPVAAIVPYNYAVFCEKIAAANGVADVISCLREARNAHGAPLIHPFIVNTIDKSVGALSLHNEYPLIIDMNAKVEMSGNKARAISFDKDGLSGHVSIVQVSGYMKIMAILFGIPGDAYAAFLMSDGEEIPFESSGANQMTINGKNIKFDTDLELTRIVIKQ